MGTKEKFWCEIEGSRCVFKIGRPGTGENWAEKLAAELAALLHIPHARVDLAAHGGRQGVLSYSVLPSERAVHIYGNQMLRRIVRDYPPPRPDHGRQRTTQHQVDFVSLVIESAARVIPDSWTLPPGITSPVEVFLGYLLFDAWIGNTDRHDENWALIGELGPESSNEFVIYLSPTFDHASSLGRELRDKRRRQILQEDSMARYVGKCRSAFYESPTDRIPMSPIAAFVHVGNRFPRAALAWLDQLAQIAEESVQLLLERFPAGWMSPASCQFATAMLDHTKELLLDCRGEFAQ